MSLTDRIKQHHSEHRVGTMKYCKTCGRIHMFPRYQEGPRELPPPGNLALALVAQTLAALIVALLAYGLLVGWLIGGPV